MSVVAIVESLWRYPVKSMRGEELAEAYATSSGFHGDRLFAFRSSSSRVDFPYFTARDYTGLLKYQARFFAEYELSSPVVEVAMPDHERLVIDDPRLLQRICRETGYGTSELAVIRSHEPMTDCSPISLISTQTARKLEDETGMTLDKRRFRANVYLNLTEASGFGEDAFVGRSLQIGSKVVIAVQKRDTRCKMITLDPDNGERTPGLLAHVGRAHNGAAGVYGDVVAEGTVRTGDVVTLLD